MIISVYKIYYRKIKIIKKVGIGDGGMQLIVRKEYLNELIELYGQKGPAAVNVTAI